MADQQWENLKEIFNAAVVLPSRERSAYLDKACGPDAELRAAVDSLLKSHEQTKNFVDEPAYRAVADLLVNAGQFSKGQVVAHYRILSLLGEGGMGRVYLAEDTKLYRKVSLKFLSANFTRDEDRLRRFKQEARAVSTLNHPNILTIHEIGEEEGKEFIATEFIEGQTLRKRMSHHFEIEEALEIAIQVASALVAAHRVNIVHRDIKPENIMIRSEDGLVKVLDFGLAKKSVGPSIPAGSDIDTALMANTSPGVIIGTVSYMSPEQARGEIVDERTDIWSLGVVLYEMVAGCSPFAAASSNEIISAILSRREAPPLSRYSHLVPERLEEIVEKALTKNRDERYQTSKDFLIDLKRLKQSLEAKAANERTASTENVVSSSRERMQATDANATRPTSSAEYIVTQVKAHKRGAAAMAALLVFAIAIGAAIYAWRLKHTSAATAPMQIKSLAVLPFKSLDTNDKYFGIAIADAVIRKVSQTGRLTVRPTSAVLKYLKEDTDSLTAARELLADAILEGTVQRAGDRLRVTVNLLRVNDGTSLYADNFDLTTADVFAIQDKVAQQIAARLQISFADQQLNERYPTNPDAYEAYIKGVISLDERGYGDEALPQMNDTINFFKKAIEIDPKYALAHAQLAFAYTWTALFINPTETKWADLSRTEIKQANDLNANLPETHIARSLLFWSSYDGYQNAEAIRESRLVKQLNPNSASPDLPAMYGHVGLDDLAVRELKRAMEINPTSQSLKELTVILPFLRADADAQWAASRKLDPRVSDPGAWYYLQKGRLEDAQKDIEERARKAPADSDLLLREALLFALKGDFQKAETKVPEILATIPLSNQSRHHATYVAACIYALAGNSSESVKWLKQTAETGFPNYPLFERDRFLDRIRQTPEFIDFMATQKDQWEKMRAEFGD